MEDRKYRQAGYKQYAKEKPGKPERPSVSSTPGLPGARSVARCAACGTLLPAPTHPLAHCPNCRADLRACRQCAHFDPGHRFECTQPIPERIPDKRARNECTFFALRVTVGRNTSAGSMRPEDARRAFDNLFKK